MSNILLDVGDAHDIQLRGGGMATGGVAAGVVQWWRSHGARETRLQLVTNSIAVYYDT